MKNNKKISSKNYSDDLIRRHRSTLTSNLKTAEHKDQIPFQSKLVLSLTEAASIIGVSTRTVERLLKRGEMQYKHIGRRVFIPRQRN